MKTSSRFFLLAASVASVLPSSVAFGQTVKPTVNCKDPVLRPNVVYVSGAVEIQPFLGTVAKLMATDPTPYTVVYQAQGACTGVGAMFTTQSKYTTLVDIPATATAAANYAIYFDAQGNTATCFLDPGGDTVDVGISTVFPTTCGYPATIAGVQDYVGPVVPMAFVVPFASSEQSISQEAAYMAFGRGGATPGGSGIPWNDASFFFIRNAKSGTQELLGLAINVPAASWWGVDQGNSKTIQQHMTAVATQPTIAERSIGILTTISSDQNGQRTNIRELAYQATGASCGYLPDSTFASYDKQNVRDGHYPLWGFAHFLTHVTNGQPSAAAAALVTRFAVPRADITLVNAEITNFTVPSCAMSVNRSTELGPLAPYTPGTECECYFAQTATGAVPSYCQSCTGSGNCNQPGRPACNYGWCEVQ